MMKISPKRIAGAGSFAVAAGVSAVLLGTAGLASDHAAAARPASQQRVAIGATGAAATGLTLSVKPAPVRIAVQPLKITLTSATKAGKKTETVTGTVQSVHGDTIVLQVKCGGRVEDVVVSSSTVYKDRAPVAGLSAVTPGEKITVVGTTASATTIDATTIDLAAMRDPGSHGSGGYGHGGH
jgi:hypothetical protein